ncbi:hypothetical protein C8J56DRAFT_771341, partial [Mycena floridula]
SVLCPHCLAIEHLRLWRPSPLSVSRRNRDSLVVMKEDTLRHIEGVMTMGWAEGTLETFDSGLLLCHVNCDTWGVREELRAPATYALLQTFMTSMAGLYSGGTARNYFNAIRAWHLMHGVPWNIEKDEFQVLLRGVDALTPAASKRPKQAPFTIAYILAIRAQLNLTQHLDISVFSALTTLFYGTGRVREVL